jgi:hypothetical protein
VHSSSTGGVAEVRFNAVAPSLIKTDPVAAITSDPQLVAKSEDRVALGWAGIPYR